MKGGIIDHKLELRLCDCGYEPELIWHYVKGIANLEHYFIRCTNCGLRTEYGKHINGAMDAWNGGKNLKADKRRILSG